MLENKTFVTLDVLTRYAKIRFSCRMCTMTTSPPPHPTVQHSDTISLRLEEGDRVRLWPSHVSDAVGREPWQRAIACGFLR